MFKDKVDLYIKVKKILIDQFHNDSELNKYISFCEDFFMGNLEWSAITNRYSQLSEEFVFIGPMRTYYSA